MDTCPDIYIWIQVHYMYMCPDTGVELEVHLHPDQ